uniref:Uncharacterized protein n=1 Tax=Triticum urartu TaxID=4572 RepID=A0A8R7V0M7_TRIUA
AAVATTSSRASRDKSGCVASSLSMWWKKCLPMPVIPHSLAKVGLRCGGGAVVTRK